MSDTDDLVKRLRMAHYPPAPTMYEAADKIEALTARVAEYKKFLADWHEQIQDQYRSIAEQDARISALEADNTRLREALENISEAGPFDREGFSYDEEFFDIYDGGYCDGLAVQGKQARAALNTKPEGGE